MLLHTFDDIRCLATNIFLYFSYVYHVHSIYCREFKTFCLFVKRNKRINICFYYINFFGLEIAILWAVRVKQCVNSTVFKTPVARTSFKIRRRLCRCRYLTQYHIEIVLSTHLVRIIQLQAGRSGPGYNEWTQSYKVGRHTGAWVFNTNVEWSQKYVRSHSTSFT